MDDGDQQFVLRWHYHHHTLMHNLPCLLENDVLTDVTLSVGSQFVRAHRLVLAMCSVYFLQLFQEMRNTQHPVVVLHNVAIEDIRAVLSFIYRGQCVVSQEQLPSLLSVAKLLKIQGLCDMKVPETDNQNDQTLNEKNETKLPTSFYDNNNSYIDYSECYNVKRPKQEEKQSSKGDEVEEVRLPEPWESTSTVITDNPACKPEDLSSGTHTPKKAVNKDASETCKCFLCGKYLSNQYNLRVHMETHEESYHACQSCPHVSRSRDALRKHVSYRHPEEYHTRKRKKTDN